MSVQIRALGVTCAVCAGALGGLPAMAQTPAAGDDAVLLQEVIVTAQKREERLQDVPIPISVISAKELEDQHVYTIADLARTAPALEMIQAFGGPGGGGQIRGIGTTSFTRSAEGAVGIVVDGVPQGNANSSNIFDMQRVEVLRGPQGTLFGLTSSAGVINMVTIAPDPAKFEIKAHLDYSDKGTLGSKFGQQTLRGVVNIPLSGASALRVSANVDTVKGVQRNAYNGVDNKRTDSGLRVRYRWSESERLDVNLIADYSRFTANYADPQFTYIIVPPGPLVGELAACGITASYGNQSRCSNQSNKSSGKNYGLSAQFDWQLANNATLTSITGYRKNETGPDDVDIMATPAEFTQIFATGEVSSRRQISQELRISSPSGVRLEYTAGVFLSDYAGTSDRAPGGAFNVGSYQVAPVFVNFVKSANSTRTTNKATAAFGQISYHGTEQLTFLAGVRFTTQKLTDSASANRYDAMSTATVPISFSKDNISGKLGAQYKFSANATGYLTATRGYKGPQVQSAAQGSPATIINAEIPTAYEIGLKGTAANGRLGYDFNAFTTKVKDYQGQRCGLNGVGVLVCLPESVDADTKGFELSLNAQLARNWSVNAGYIYNVAQYPNGWTGYNPDDLRDPTRVNGVVVLGPGTTSLSRQQLVNSPKNKFTFSTDYSHALGAVEGFFNADTVYKSDVRLGPSGDPRFIYPAHWITGLRIGLRSQDDRWSVSLFARNVGNENEPVTIFGGPAFVPPGVVPFIPNGHVSGISGWIAQNSLRHVGLSIDAKF